MATVGISAGGLGSGWLDPEPRDPSLGPGVREGDAQEHPRTRDLGGEDRDASIVEAIIAMARGLRMAVAAEGVEMYEQAEVLAALNCSHAQGYLFSPPVTAGDIEGMLHGGVELAQLTRPVLPS